MLRVYIQVAIYVGEFLRGRHIGNQPRPSLVVTTKEQLAWRPQQWCQVAAVAVRHLLCPGTLMTMDDMFSRLRYKQSTNT